MQTQSCAYVLSNFCFQLWHVLAPAGQQRHCSSRRRRATCWGAPSTLCGAVRARSIVARPKSPIFTTPSLPLMKMLSHCGAQVSARAGMGAPAWGSIDKPASTRQAQHSSHPTKEYASGSHLEVSAGHRDSCQPGEGHSMSSLAASCTGLDSRPHRHDCSPVANGRRVAVQIHQAAQDLPGPALQHLAVYLLVPLAVPAQLSLSACSPQAIAAAAATELTTLASKEQGRTGAACQR